jgi:putative transposase
MASRSSLLARAAPVAHIWPVLPDVGYSMLPAQNFRCYHRFVPHGLKRYHHSEQSHFINFSCYRRETHLQNRVLADIFLRSLQYIRTRYGFRVYGYVVMPEHVHLLISEPEVATVANAIQALKISVARYARTLGISPFWQKRYFDHNVRTHRSFLDKLRYIHRNPVKRQLCAKPEDWPWSSFRHYSFAEVGIVEIESEWTAARRNGHEPRILQPPPEP